MNFSLLESENAAPQEKVVTRQPLLHFLNDQRGSVRVDPAGLVAIGLTSALMGAVLADNFVPKGILAQIFPEGIAWNINRENMPAPQSSSTATPVPQEISFYESFRFKGSIDLIENALKNQGALFNKYPQRKWTVRLLPRVIDRVEVIDSKGIVPTNLPTITEVSQEAGILEAGKTYYPEVDILVTEAEEETGLRHEWLVWLKTSTEQQAARVYTYNPQETYPNYRANILDKQGKELAISELKRLAKLSREIESRTFIQPYMIVTPTATVTIGPAFDWTAIPTTQK